MTEDKTSPFASDDDGHGWDYAVLDLSDGRPHVDFSNGQPSWESINGKRLGWRTMNEAFARLDGDGWLLAGVEHSRAPGIFHAATRPSAYRYRRPAPTVPFVYREVFCSSASRELRFHPHIVVEVEAAFDHVPAIIEPCLEPHLRDGWERDPYPSALDPQLGSPLVARWGRWTIQAVKVRLRQRSDVAADAPAGDILALHVE